MALPQAGEARKIAISGDEFAAVLDSQGRMIGVCDEFSASPGGDAKFGKDFPASWTMREQSRVGPGAQTLDELDSVLGRRRFVPDLRVGYDANEAAGSQF